MQTIGLWPTALHIDTRIRALRRYRREVTEWQRAGKTNPPPHVLKQRVVRAYARRFRTRTLVETGTFLGDMVEAVRDAFGAIFSIELDPQLACLAQTRFQLQSHIEIIQGDSAQVLPRLLERITTPALFWLDGHWSDGITARGEVDTPVREELRAILSHPVRSHVILIDDARCFDGTCDYPALPELWDITSALGPEYVHDVADNIIRIHRPPGSKLRWRAARPEAVLPQPR